MKKTLLSALVAPILMVMFTAPVFAEEIPDSDLGTPKELETIKADVEVTEGYDLADPVYFVEYGFSFNSADESFSGEDKKFYFKYNESANNYTWDPSTLSYVKNESSSSTAGFDKQSLTADVTFNITNKSNVAIHYKLEFDGNPDNFTSSFTKAESSTSNLEANLPCLYNDPILNDGSYTNKVHINDVDTETVEAEVTNDIRATVDGTLTVTANGAYEPTENVQDVEIGVLKLTISAVDYVN